MAHYGMGDYLVAIPYLKQAAKMDPQSLPLRLTLAHSCLWSKQYQCVMDVYKEILALNAESAEADMLAGEASTPKATFPEQPSSSAPQSRPTPKNQMPTSASDTCSGSRKNTTKQRKSF